MDPLKGHSEVIVKRVLGIYFSAFNCKDLHNWLWSRGKTLKPSTIHACQCIGQVHHMCVSIGQASFTILPHVFTMG